MVFAIHWHESATGVHVHPHPHSIPLGCPRALALNALLHASNLHWSSISHGNRHVSVLFSQITPPSPSPTESKSLFFTSVSLLLPCIYSRPYCLSKFHIYALIYCIGVSLSDLLHYVTGGFPGGSEVKSSAYNVGDLGSILGQEDPLEKETATHSSILAWKIPWMEDPGELQSTGLQSRTRLSNFTFTM